TTVYSNGRVQLNWKDNATTETAYRVTRTGGSEGQVDIDLPADATSWFDDTGLTSNQTYTYKVVALNVVGESEPATATARAVAGALPSEWQSQDVGYPVFTGVSGYVNGVFDVTGGGADIWGTSDNFQYVYQIQSGDFVMTTKVNSQWNTNEWAKAGIIVRAGTDQLDGTYDENNNYNYDGTYVMDVSNASAPWAMMAATPKHGVQFQWKTLQGVNGNVAYQDGTSSVGYYLRVVRVGTEITGWYSADGSEGSWTQLDGTYTVNSGEVAVGLGVTSHDDAIGKQSLATFSNVLLTDWDPTVSPASPTMTSITSLGATAATVVFTNHAPTATSFRIQRATTPDFSDAVNVGTVPDGTTGTISFLDNTMPAPGTYYYRAMAVNSNASAGAQESDWSEGMSISTAVNQGSFNLSDFSDASKLQLNGTAAVVGTGSNAILRLTDTATGQTGSAFTKLPADITKFNISFDFRMGGGTGADGMAFVIQGVAPTALGGGGGGLGYSGIANSMALKFDAYQITAGTRFIEET
ncbi:MAG TPA: hypothetical protein VHP11_04165, partial [Tepidisphaeraceae bacterium]|nr:hypothetical protein [Tepidisphaeraceae bacterium]